MGVAHRCSHWTVNRNQRRSHQQPHSVALVRASGFAVADQQLETGFRTIAVPVRNRAGVVVAGITVIVPVARTGLAQMAARYLEPLIQTAATLSTALAQ